MTSALVTNFISCIIEPRAYSYSFWTLTESDVFVASTTASLSDIAGVTIVAPSLGTSQGLVGNPTNVNMTPALNVGHTVDSTVVSIGILSGPGVILPKFVSREFLDGTLKAVQENFTT